MLHTARANEDTQSDTHTPSASAHQNGAGEGVRAGDVDECGAGAGLPGGGGRRVRGRQHRLQCPVQEHKSPEHLARNPFGQIPAFQDGDLFLWESRAISKYVLRKYKTSEVDLLRDGNLKEAAMVDVWTEVDVHTYNPALSPIVYQCLFNPMMFGIPTDEKVVAESLEKLKKVLEVYEARLSQHKYLAGDFVSFSDLNHFPHTFYFMATPHTSLFDSYPHVKAWWERIMARPSVKKISGSLVPPRA